MYILHVQLPTDLSLYVSVYLTELSIHRIYLSIYPWIERRICLSIYLSICLPAYPPTYLSMSIHQNDIDIDMSRQTDTFLYI